jgi:hypothetical protein
MFYSLSYIFVERHSIVFPAINLGMYQIYHLQISAKGVFR